MANFRLFNTMICWSLALLIGVLTLTGCSSIGKGAIEALLEKSETEDTRICQIWGKPFQGIEPSLSKTAGKTKVLMVHGVGDHLPGYATEFLEKLARELKLNARSGSYKNITLTSTLADDAKSLGNLRITHLFNEESSRDLLFYELTWSEITRKEKELLAFDNSGEYNFRRAKINSMLKTFSNDTGPDPIIYLGESREKILTAFSQSFCWMATHDWDDLPEDGLHACRGLTEMSAKHITNDDFVVISHSLGSRIAIDGTQRIAELLSHPERFVHQVTRSAQGIETTQSGGRKVYINMAAIEALQKKRIPFFMLSNQLPMLQLGRELPAVAGQQKSYCDPAGVNYGKRVLSETAIIAFSDPNDLLSYAIPPGFSDKYIDSRLCPSITNININIAKVIDAFGISDIANPLEAHVGYDSDERVIALIAQGIGNQNTAPLIKGKCDWTKVVQ